jgi:hypothetical protein
MSFSQGRRKRDDRGIPIEYVAGKHVTENAAGKHFQRSQIKSLHPHAQGRRLEKLRGTTLIQL